MPYVDLASTGDRLAALAEQQSSRIASRARRLADRQRAHRFHVAVVGDFNRGKSTVINALVGTTIVPTGVLPVTAVPTEVMFGASGATVVLLDGSHAAIGVEDVAAYVAEAANPGNEKEVEHVEIRFAAPLLRSGIVLIDTPGTGSIHHHNTSVALDAHAAADGAIVVLDAGSPLSAAEKAILGSFLARADQVFVLINKADRLDPGERNEVRCFVAETTGFPQSRIWATDARAAAVGGDGLEFAAFVTALRDLADGDLAEARDRATRIGLVELATDLGDLVRLEIGAARLDADDRLRRIARMDAAVHSARHTLAAEQHLLVERCHQISRQVGDRLAEFARTEPACHDDELRAIGQATAPVGLDDALRAGVATAVRSSFDAFLRDLQTQLDVQWQRAATGLRDTVTERVREARATTADLFDVELRDVPIPLVAAVTSDFSYLFLPPMSMSEPFITAGRHLVPAPVVRRRLTDRALEDLRREFDKHAGRARHDLVKRLDQVRATFEASMREHVDSAAVSLLGAVQRAARRAASDDAAAESHLGMLLSELDQLNAQLATGPSPSVPA